MTQNINPKEPRQKYHKKRCYPRRKTSGSMETPAGLEEEIAALRLVMRRVQALLDEGHTLADLLRVLDVLSKASTRMAYIMRNQSRLNGNTNDLAREISEAIKEASEKLVFGDDKSDQ